MIVAVDNDASSAEIVDIAAAKIAAINRPTSPIGMAVVINVGKT
jgi:hypothetical protein